MSKQNKQQQPSKQTKTAQPSKKAAAPAVATVTPMVKAAAPAAPQPAPVSAAQALATEIAKNEPPMATATATVGPVVIKSAQAQCRVMFAEVGARHTLQEIQAGRFTTSAVLTALSDLKNPKYAKGGDCIFIHRDPNAEGKTYVRVQ